MIRLLAILAVLLLAGCTPGGWIGHGGRAHKITDDAPIGCLVLALAIMAAAKASKRN